MFFSSGMGSRPSRMAPWTPWIDRKIKKKIQEIDLLDDFSIFDPWRAPGAGRSNSVDLRSSSTSPKASPSFLRFKKKASSVGFCETHDELRA